MTIFINVQKKQIFAKWVSDGGFDNELKMWEKHGWLAVMTNTSLSWQQVIAGWQKLNRAERLKLEKELFG